MIRDRWRPRAVDKLSDVLLPGWWESAGTLSIKMTNVCSLLSRDTLARVCNDKRAKLFLAASFVMIQAANNPNVIARSLVDHMTLKRHTKMPQSGRKEVRLLAMMYKNILRGINLKKLFVYLFVCL